MIQLSQDPRINHNIPGTAPREQGPGMGDGAVGGTNPKTESERTIDSETGEVPTGDWKTGPDDANDQE